MSASLPKEWLEPDGLGGFASGTVAGYRTRRYHALLLVDAGERFVLVNGLEAWLELPDGSFPLSTQHYAPDVLYPRGLDHVTAFTADPWPRWTHALPGGNAVAHELVCTAEGTVCAWRRIAGSGPATLHVRPLLSGRSYHALMRENGAFDFTPAAEGGNVAWHPYAGVPAIAVLSSGAYAHAPDWYRNFLYAQEAARGLDCIEDLATPGVFTFDLDQRDAALVLRAGRDIAGDARTLVAETFARERKRRAAPTRADRAADAYVVRVRAVAEGGKAASAASVPDVAARRHSIIAGYPWFTDWGRDTFIAMRGLLLARGRADVASMILADWSAHVSEGMLPNRFPDGNEPPQYNAVDASLWFVIVAHETMAVAGHSAALSAAIGAILDGYTRGTRFGIRMDADGLLACGAPGTQLTWMDARVDGRAVTPRVGKPVEVQALWINALRLAGRAAEADRATAAFRARFVDADRGCLHDVVDADHVAGSVDASVRPNQVFAVGGLPIALVEDGIARNVLATVERDLVTPAGLRSLSPADPAYCPRYEGGPAQRDAAYHQGTVWPWLMGAFVDAWLRVHGRDAQATAEARERFVDPLSAHVGAAGIDHLSEIADGDAPHAPRGCPFQAWSLGELIRAQAMVAP
ncbi:MAG: amylo-alpha-1,6-glucosidase [Burkholderiales bacterium]